jgi:hypothetical protein
MVSTISGQCGLVVGADSQLAKLHFTTAGAIQTAEDVE